MPRTILVVDDEIDMLQLLKRSLEPELDCRVDIAASGEEALELIGRQHHSLILLDIKMPGMNGLEVLEQIKRDDPDQTVVMMTAYGRIDIAVEAMKRGAYDFITKPFDHDALVLRLEKALERSRLIEENLRLHQAVDDDMAFQGMVGKSPAIQRAFSTIEMVAKTDLTVLITGESGTGKDLAARAIHALSPRHKGPFVPVNCPAVPEHILESELFGYKKGAFTHATRNKSGLFQEADGGTIFLDEIGDISPTIQTKMLRVLQEKEIKPLGDTRSIRIDTRIVSSTNQQLEEKKRDGSYRDDFFYRISVLPIHLPPLRERRDDIPLLANHFMKKHCAKLEIPVKSLSAEVLDLLVNHRWVGNIREMENVIVQGILFSGDKEIQPQHLGLERSSDPACLVDQPTELLPYKAAKEQTLQQFNQRYIGQLLQQSKGNVTQAAKRCGLERQALQQVMRRYGITAAPYRKSS